MIKLKWDKLFAIGLLIISANSHAEYEWCWGNTYEGVIGQQQNLIATHEIGADNEYDLNRKCKQKCYLNDNCKLISFHHDAVSLTHQCNVYSASDLVNTPDGSGISVKCPGSPASN